jgi:hypothetical protein
MFDVAVAFDDELSFERLKIGDADERHRVALTFDARRGGRRVTMVVTCPEADARVIASGLLAAHWVRPKPTGRFARPRVAAAVAD